MATRLYPKTADTNKLEKLAGVSAGTRTRLATVQAKFHVPNNATFHEHQDAYEQMLIELEQDEQLSKLDNFILFGWGKFLIPPELSVETFATVGRLTGQEAITLMRYNGIQASLDDCDGEIYWC